MSRAALMALNLCVVAAISYLDWLRAPGVVVGILLGLPILLASTGRHRLDVWIVFVASLIGFEVAAIYGQGVFTPAMVWVPNRILAALLLPGTLGLALVLQRLRHRSEQAAAEAERSSDLNRLLISLLAHDLRSPLALAIQTLVYLEEQSETGATDQDLVTDVRARLRRSLTTIDRVLGLAREPTGSGIETATGAEIAAEIQREVEAFADEARAREKRLEVDVTGDAGAVWQVDLRVMRQAISILVDNAIRHSLPGAIRVCGTVAENGFEVRVGDPGPMAGQGLAGEGEGGGLGLGLELCRALVLRAGGRIELATGASTGKVFVLRLPISRGQVMGWRS